MDAPREHYAKWDRPVTKGQVLYDSTDTGTWCNQIHRNRTEWWFPRANETGKCRFVAVPVVMHDVRTGPWRRLSAKELMFLYCGAGDDSWESLGQGEIKPVNPQGNQPWIFIGWTAAEAEAPILWPPDVKNWLTGKDPDAWKDWGQEERRTAEDETAGWNHWLNGHEFEKTPGDSEEQGSLPCCSPWGGKESDTILATKQ